MNCAINYDDVEVASTGFWEVFRTLFEDFLQRQQISFLVQITVNEKLLI